MFTEPVKQPSDTILSRKKFHYVHHICCFLCSLAKQSINLFAFKPPYYQNEILECFYIGLRCWGADAVPCYLRCSWTYRNEILYRDRQSNSSNMEKIYLKLMHQSIPSTNIPPGDPRGFALYCCPKARIYT